MHARVWRWNVGGDTLSEAIEQCVLGMFGFVTFLISHSRYMTDMEKVDVDLEQTPIVVKARGHDCLSLLYDILNEFLCSNSTMDYLMRDVRVITELDGKDFSSARLLGFASLLPMTGRFGERYNPAKHTQGTEVKAITYSNMQVHVRDNITHIYVILDIFPVCNKHPNPAYCALDPVSCSSGPSVCSRCPRTASSPSPRFSVDPSS